jgi:hypothetical protein
LGFLLASAGFFSADTLPAYQTDGKAQLIGWQYLGIAPVPARVVGQFPSRGPDGRRRKKFPALSALSCNGFGSRPPASTFLWLTCSAKTLLCPFMSQTHGRSETHSAFNIAHLKGSPFSQ